jgi:hypothetical protein
MKRAFLSHLLSADAEGQETDANSLLRFLGVIREFDDCRALLTEGFRSPETRLIHYSRSFIA